MSTPTITDVERRIAASASVDSLRSKDSLVKLLVHSREMYKEWIRRAVLKRDRLDVLCELVLGYSVHPNIHFPLIRHQFTHPNSQTLIFRGAGKTTVGTVAKIIHLILVNPNIRILLGSKVATNSADMLHEVKQHFESNEELREVFGHFVGERQWDETSIEVRPRTTIWKEPTVMTVGVGTAIASKHFDVGIVDDIVAEENSRTEHQREAIKKWYYKVFSPCIEPPDPHIPHRGERHVLGTRYHHEDLYGHFLTHEFKNSTLIVPALDENDESTYPERFTTSFLREQREKAGVIIFNSQYQCDTEAMRGEVFNYDDCEITLVDQWPDVSQLVVAAAADLAIGKKTTNDYFATVAVGRDANEHFWVLDFTERRLGFLEQQTTIEEFYQRYERQMLAFGIEAVAYQAAQFTELKRKHPLWHIRKIIPIKDKVTRAWKLTPLFEQHRVHFCPEHHHIIERLVSFPHGHDDLFDALEMAIGLLRFKPKQRANREEPGLL